MNSLSKTSRVEDAPLEAPALSTGFADDDSMQATKSASYSTVMRARRAATLITGSLQYHIRADRADASGYHPSLIERVGSLGANRVVVSLMSGSDPDETLKKIRAIYPEAHALTVETKNADELVFGIPRLTAAVLSADSGKRAYQVYRELMQRTLNLPIPEEMVPVPGHPFRVSDMTPYLQAVTVEPVGNTHQIVLTRSSELVRRAAGLKKGDAIKDLQGFLSGSDLPIRKVARGTSELYGIKIILK